MGFIGEAIQVEFVDKPFLEKDPPCPRSVTWRGKTYAVAEMLREAHDYGRRGKVADNMRSAHLRAALRRGSWGVGRSSFRVRTTEGEVFDLYYDRAPSAGGRKGGWFLYRQVSDET